MLVPVADLRRSVSEFEGRYGLISVDGGRHPDWGTANRIVPLGDAYLELVAVVDAERAGRSVFGRWIANAAVGRPLSWAVRTSDLDETAQRLDLTVRSGSRLAPGGQVLRWRIAGFERSMAQPYLPFFIEWAPGTPFPGRTRVDQPAPIQKVTRLALQGEIAQLEEWLGDERLPVTVAAGPPAVIGVGLATGSGEMFIGPP